MALEAWALSWLRNAEMQSQGIVEGLPKLKEETLRCKACQLGKKIRKPFLKIAWRTTKKLQLIKGIRSLEDIYQRCNITVCETTNFEEAKENEKWRVAMKEDLTMIERNKTWEAG